MATVLAVAGSPSTTSRSAALVERATEHLTDLGVEVDTLLLRDLPAEPLIAADAGHPALAEANARLEAARGVIIGTPVYKASFSGLLKVWLDQLPQFGMKGKTILPLAVGGGTAHILILDYALRPVLRSFDPAHVTAGYFVHEPNVVRDEDGKVKLPAEIDADLRSLVESFRDNL